MMIAMPAIYPAVTGYGMNRITSPSRASAMITRKQPAISVASASPWYPNSPITPATSTTNAPVAPPICTRLPPNTEIRNPPTIAV